MTLGVSKTVFVNQESNGIMRIVLKLIENLIKII